MEALTLNDPPRPSKLRPLLLVANRQKPSTGLPRPPLSQPALSIDALTRRMEALTLSDRPPTNPGASLPEPDYAMDALIRSMGTLSLSGALPSASKLKPLLLVTKRASGQLEVRTPPSTPLPLPQPTTTLTRDVTTSLPVPYKLELFRPRGSWSLHVDARLRFTPCSRCQRSPTTNSDDTSNHTMASLTVPYDPELRRPRSRRPSPVYPPTMSPVFDARGPLRPDSDDAPNGPLHRPRRPEEGRSSWSRALLSQQVAFPFLLHILEVFLICILLYWYETGIGLISGMYVYFSHFLLYLEVLFDLFSPLLLRDRHWTRSISLRTHLWHVS
ncbi:hypothetical protein DFH29DRAFT_887855 [Suillus ampliporus]|nr:hypothetical protein DFH29DRAFT_887855 [Suillus ampliporus]